MADLLRDELLLYGILQHVGAELSAHETITAEQDAWGSVAQLAAEYETLAAAAQHDRWAIVVRASGLTRAQADAAIESDAFGPFTAELRRAGGGIPRVRGRPGHRGGAAVPCRRSRSSGCCRGSLATRTAPGRRPHPSRARPDGRDYA